MKMSSTYVMVVLTLAFTATYADQLRRIESKLKALDLKLSANSIEISILKNEVADTNKKLEVLIEMMNTQPVMSSNTRSTDSEIGPSLQPLHSPRGVDDMLSSEISRVRRAFAAEKKNIAQQQQRINDQFVNFAETFNASLVMFHDSQNKRYVSAFNSINDSIALALGDLHGDVINQLVQLNTLQDKIDDNTNKTQSKLNTLEHVVRTLNDNIRESINVVGKNVVDFINESLNVHDNVTNNAQNFTFSALTKISDSSNYLKENIPKMLYDIRDSIRGAHQKTVDRINNLIRNSDDRLKRRLDHIESHIEYLVIKSY